MPRWNENPHPDKWANMKEVAEILGIHPAAGANAMNVAGIPIFKHRGIRYVLLSDLRPYAETYPKQLWADEEIDLLQSMWGYHSIGVIAERLDRTPTAVEVKAKRLKLRSPVSWPGVLTEYRLAPLLKLDRKTVWRHMQPGGIFPALTLYKSHTPVRIVYEDMMAHWLGHFDNWIYFRDVTEIEYPPFAAAIRKTRQRLDGDIWLMPKEAAELIGIPVRYLNAKIHKGSLPAKKWQYWRVRKSDALDFRQQLNYHKRFATNGGAS